MRLLKASPGWWFVTDDGVHVVRLPSEAARAAGDTESRGEWVGDRERNILLLPAAVEALTGAGLLPESTSSRGAVTSEGDGDTYAVTVLTATTCNLGCNYCFQNTSMAPEGSHAPPRIKASRLNTDDISAIALFVKKQQERYQKTKSTLLIFGGEPLLNKAGTLELLSAFQPLGLTDSEIVTNGVLLSGTMARKMYAGGLNRVQITFDGDKAAHDSTRVTRSGRPTYDRILENVGRSMAEAPGLNWNFRVNVSHRNVANLSYLVEDLGRVLRPGIKASLNLSLINDTGLGYDNQVGFQQALASTFLSLYCQSIDLGFKVLPVSVVENCPYCGVIGGETGAVINGDGGLYSCWENAGRDGWAVGNVREGYITGQALEDRWVDCRFDAGSHGDGQAARAFFDYIDSGILDYQYSHGTLDSVGARQ